MGLAPIVVTPSLAQQPGRLLGRDGAERLLPLITEREELPAEVAGKAVFSPREVGEELVLPGELGGVSDEDEYILVALDRVLPGETLERVSCRGTEHRFVRCSADWWEYHRIGDTVPHPASPSWG